MTQIRALQIIISIIILNSLHRDARISLLTAALTLNDTDIKYMRCKISIVTKQSSGAMMCFPFYVFIWNMIKRKKYLKEPKLKFDMFKKIVFWILYFCPPVPKLIHSIYPFITLSLIKFSLINTYTTETTMYVFI